MSCREKRLRLCRPAGAHGRSRLIILQQFDEQKNSRLSDSTFDHHRAFNDDQIGVKNLCQTPGS